MATPQELALASFMAFQNSGSDPWGDMDRRRAEVAREQAEIDSRRDWVPVSGFDPFVNSWEAKFVPPQRALDIENFQLQSEHPGARLIDDPFQYGFNRGMRAVAKPTVAEKPRFMKAGNDWLTFNPDTGGLDMAFKGEASISPATKARIDVLKSAIQKAQAEYLKAPDEVTKGTLARTLRGFNQQLEALFADAEAPAIEAEAMSPTVQPPRTRPEADSLSMFGEVGARTPFAFSGGSAPPPITPTNRVRILNIRRR